METICLAAILLLRVFQKISSKACSNEMPVDPTGVSGYMSVQFGISAVFALILFIFTENPAEAVRGLTALGWVISAATGLALTVSLVCSLLALHGSSIVLGALFSMAGLLVPTVAGIFIFGQKVSLLQWGGIVFLFVSAYFLWSASQKTNGRLTFKTLLLLLGSMLANGCTMLFQTLYKAFVPDGSVTLYSFLQFAVPSVAMLAVFGAKSGLNKKYSVSFSRKLIFFTAVAAISLFGISQISTIASEIIPIAVLFPVSDGGGMVISALVAAAVYKEKLSVKSGIGIIIGITAVCIMKLG